MSVTPINRYTERIVEIDGTRMTREVTFTQHSSLHSDFKPYDSLDAATVLEWVKTALGDEVAKKAAAMDAVVTLVKTPTSATGVPW